MATYDEELAAARASKMPYGESLGTAAKAVFGLPTRLVGRALGVPAYLPKASAETQNAVATTAAMSTPGTSGYRDLEANPPAPDFTGLTRGGPRTGPGAMDAPPAAPAAYDANMPNGSIRTVYQDTTYPGATPASVAPAATMLPVANIPSYGGDGGSGIDFGLPRMRAAGVFNEGGGGGVVSGGLFPPGLMSAIQQYHDLSTKADDGSIAGAWRSRGFAKQRDRLLAGAANALTAESGAVTAGAHVTGANAAMLRAVNEPALEGMKNIVAMRGQDVTGRGQTLAYNLGALQDTTHRYGIDTTAATSRANTLDTVAASKYHTDVGAMLGLPKARIEDLAGQAFAAGQYDAGGRIMGHNPPQPKLPTFHGDAVQGGVLVNPDGSWTPITPQMIKERSLGADEARKKRAAEVAAGK